MTQLLSPLPGTGCMYYTEGHCMIKISADPGFHDEWICTVLAKWETAFDAYLDQVECFEVDQDTVMKIWARRFESIQAEASCPHFEPGHATILSCVHLHFDLCRRKIPLCPGRCKHYTREE